MIRQKHMDSYFFSQYVKQHWDFYYSTSYQAKYKDAHEKAKGHYMAGTLVDFPEVMRCGEQEKNKGLVRYRYSLHIYSIDLNPKAQ